MEDKIQKRLGVGSMIAVMMAYTCSVTNVPNGANIGEGATFTNGLIGILLAFVMATIVIALVGMVGQKTGVTKDLVWKSIFGRRGYMLCSIIFAFCQSFWACYDFFNAGQAIYNLMPDGTMLKNLGFCIAIGIMLVLTILGGVFGIMGVKWISTLTLPVGVILFLVIAFTAMNNAGGMEGLTAYVPETETLGIMSACQIMFGMWMAGYAGMMDLTPEAKSTKAVVIGSVCAAAFIALCFIVGQIGFIGTGMKTVGDICLSLGGAIFICGNIFVMLAQGNTTPACNYMYSLSYSEGLKLDRKKLAVVVPIIVAAISFYIMYGAGVDFISTIANLVSCLMAPLVAITISEFFIVTKQTLEIKTDENLPTVAPASMITLIVGSGVSILCSYVITIPLQSLWVILFTIILHCILRLGAKMK